MHSLANYSVILWGEKGYLCLSKKCLKAFYVVMYLSKPMHYILNNEKKEKKLNNITEIELFTWENKASQNANVTKDTWFS